MKDRNREIALMPELDSEEAFDAYFAEKTAATAPYRDRQGRLVLDDIHDLPEVVEKVVAGRTSRCWEVRFFASISKRSVLK